MQNSKSNSVRLILSVLSVASLIALLPAPVPAQTVEDALKMARNLIKADRQAVVTEALQLTEKEGRAFWPIYYDYRAEMDKVANGLVKLVRDYAEYYPNVPDDRAKEMLKEMTELERQLTRTRASYLRKFGKVLPPAKNLRFAQVENRLDVALRLKLAVLLPLNPIEGGFTPNSSAAAAYTEGTPGGTIVQTVELKATVAAIDKANRKITVVSPDGIKKTIKAGPEVANFDQIRLGDQLKVTATEELVVRMGKLGEANDDGGAALVALAPKGAKPGALTAETVRITAIIKAIDVANRKVTLWFPDGSTHVVTVRKDVDLSERKVGEQVVIRSTETLAISVEKQ